MRINNSRSSEIFDIFSDTMQKFNQKRQDLLTKEASRAGAVDDIAKLFGAGQDLGRATDVLIGSGGKVQRFMVGTGDSAVEVLGIARKKRIPGLSGVNVLTSVDNKSFIPINDILSSVRAGAPITENGVRAIIGQRKAFQIVEGIGDDGKRFIKALREAGIGTGRGRPKALLSTDKVDLAVRRLCLEAFANEGKIDPKHFERVLGEFSDVEVAAIQKRYKQISRAASSADEVAEGAADAGRVDPVAPRPDPADIDPAAPRPDPVDPADPAAPRPDPADPADPAAPRPDPADPADPAAPRPDPADPADPAAPRPDPADPADPAAPRPDPADPADPAAPRPDPADPAAPRPDPARPAPIDPETGRPRVDSPEVDAKIDGVRDELRASLEELRGAAVSADAARAGQIDALEDALRKLKDLPPNPNVMRQMDALKDAIKGLEATGGAIDATADAAKMSGKAKFLLGLTAAGAAGLAYLYWPDVKKYFEEFPNVRKHDPEKVKQLFSTAHSTMSSCASDTGTVLSSMNAVSFTDNQVERAHRRMIRELSTYNSTLAGLRKASLTPNLTQEEMRTNISALNRTMTAMGSLVSVYMEDTGEIESFARDKKLFLQMKNDIKKVLPCYQNSLDTVRDEIKRLKIDTSEGGSASAAGVASTGTSGSTNRPGGIPSNAADFMYDPTVMATDIVKLPLDESIRVGNKMINFVNIPMPRGFASRGELAIKGAPFLAAALNDSRGRTILRQEYKDISLDPKMSGLKPEDIFQFATNRAAFKILNSGANEDSLDEIEIDETFQDVVRPRSEDKDEAWYAPWRDDIDDRAGERARSGAARDAQRLGFADDGVTASSRKDQLKKISELIMSNENHRSSINKEVSKDSIRKKSDDFAKSYYKDAKKGLSTEDSFMKSYYAGFSDMYDESQNDKPKLDYKDSYSLHDETGDDLIHEAHPEAIVVSDAIGNGGLVENGSEQKRQSHGVAQSTPTGNYRANYAWLQEGLLKK